MLPEQCWLPPPLSSPLPPPHHHRATHILSLACNTHRLSTPTPSTPHRRNVQLARGVALGEVRGELVPRRRSSNPPKPSIIIIDLERWQAASLTHALRLPLPSKITGWRHQSAGRLCKTSLRPAGIPRYVQRQTGCLPLSLPSALPPLRLSSSLSSTSPWLSSLSAAHDRSDFLLLLHKRAYPSFYRHTLPPSISPPLPSPASSFPHPHPTSTQSPPPL